MAKEIRLKIGGQACVAELPDDGKRICIVGADSYYGAHWALWTKGHRKAVVEK